MSDLSNGVIFPKGEVNRLKSGTIPSWVGGFLTPRQVVVYTATTVNPVRQD